MRRLLVRCPAKVNLFLSVGPRDAKGYHPLRTVFQSVDLCDELEIEVGETEAGFRCDDSRVPDRNTVTRAMEILHELPPARITLRKRIPTESGLGGGSSDAAGLLRAARSLAQVSEARLHEVAAQIGADVPFFLVGGRARAEGYGEILRPLPDPLPEWYVLARPEIGCATAEMFRRLDESRYEWREFPSEDVLYNDFERVAPCESLDLIERLLAHRARDAALSGSGSAVFGRFRSESCARHAEDRLRAEGVKGTWTVRTLSREESLTVSSS